MPRRVVPSESAFWKEFGSFVAPRSYFDAQGDAHGDIDLRLVESIEALLVPRLGQWEQSDRWWHQMDFYGDGVRSLAFSAAAFTPGFVGEFQGLLHGEHEHFCILCQISDSITNEDSKIGSIAVRSNSVLVAYPLTERFDGQL